MDRGLRASILRVYILMAFGLAITAAMEFLMKILDITPTGKDTFFVNSENSSMNAKQFSAWFEDKSKKAGVNKTAHGVRKLPAILSVESGATTHDLMVIYRWKGIPQAEAKGANR